MSGIIAQSNIIVIIGMGVTGRSVARHLRARGKAFVWLDTRAAPPALAEIQQEFGELNFELGELQLDTLMAASEIILSPGVPAATPALRAAEQAGIPVIGDIDLFLREAKAPVVAITGSNAKSTVTTLVGEMATASGRQVAVGGNLGVPVLELLQEAGTDLYVLELSSFQLETVQRLNADVACILNISEDHMDRYDSLAHYHRAKQRVYYGARAAVYNREDPLTAPPQAGGVKYFSFGLNPPDRHGFGLVRDGDEEYLAFEFKPLIAARRVRLAGRHNLANALAALAIGYAAGLPMAAMLSTLETFAGLPHRCQWVAEHEGVAWYNDSKGTNVGATLAALNGLQPEAGKIVLIAGGVGKGADFSPLQAAAAGLRAVVVIGADGDKIARVFEPLLPVLRADSMAAAVQLAGQQAESGDRVLLSPACASFDMFKGFEDRGRQFEQAVREVIA